jgi:hypothetical protein
MQTTLLLLCTTHTHLPRLNPFAVVFIRGQNIADMTVGTIAEDDILQE